ISVKFFFFFFFFFQAEDGIRDFHVTGVQTCALPILCVTTKPKSQNLPLETSPTKNRKRKRPFGKEPKSRLRPMPIFSKITNSGRSEERRVGKECRSRWSPDS